MILGQSQAVAISPPERVKPSVQKFAPTFESKPLGIFLTSQSLLAAKRLQNTNIHNFGIWVFHFKHFPAR
jgi:hypothetical protein